MNTPVAPGPLAPLSVRRLGTEALSALSELQRLVLERQRLSEQIDGQVGKLRDAGASWGAVSWAVGTTGEAARQRWGVKP